MSILKSITDEKGVQTTFHRILSYMVDVDLDQVLVCIGSYTNQDVYEQEKQNRAKFKRWQYISERLAQLATEIENEQDQETKTNLQNEYNELMGEVTGSVSNKVLAYNISELYIENLQKPTLETVEEALLKQEPFINGKWIKNES